MARKRNGQTVEAPEGFDVNVGRERGEGWVKKEEGNRVQGSLMGRHSFKAANGKTRHYYQLKLQESCICEIVIEEGDEEKRESKTLPAGSIVNVDESAALSDLAKFSALLERGGQYDVWFVYKAKESIGGGQSFWPVHGPKVRTVKGPKAHNTEGDTVPF